MLNPGLIQMAGVVDERDAATMVDAGVDIIDHADQIDAEIRASG